MGNYLYSKIHQVKPLEVDSSIPSPLPLSSSMFHGKPNSYKNVNSSSMIFLKPKLEKNMNYKNVHSSSMVNLKKQFVPDNLDSKKNTTFCDISENKCVVQKLEVLANQKNMYYKNVHSSSMKPLFL